MLPVVQLPDVLPHVGSSYAGMALHTHIVPQCKNHLKGVCVWCVCVVCVCGVCVCVCVCVGGGGGGGGGGAYRVQTECVRRGIGIKFQNTFWICTASSLVGESTSICVSLSWMSTF